MSNQAAIRKALHSYIDKADDRFVEALYAMAHTYLEKDDTLVGFTPDGTPITQADLLNRVQEGVSDVQEGRLTASADLLVEIKAWQ